MFSTLKYITVGVFIGVGLLGSLGACRRLLGRHATSPILDATINGMLIAIALLYLLPLANDQLAKVHFRHALLGQAQIIVWFGLGFSLLWLTEKTIQNALISHRQMDWRMVAVVAMINATLSGLSLGLIGETASFVMIAIVLLIHKLFEINFYQMKIQRLRHLGQSISPLLSYSTIPLVLIMPAMIVLVSTLPIHHTYPQFRAIVYAMNAGTLCYVATLHTQYRYHPRVRYNSYLKYSQLLATMAGIAILAVLTIWL